MTGLFLVLAVVLVLMSWVFTILNIGSARNGSNAAETRFMTLHWLSAIVAGVMLYLSAFYPIGATPEGALQALSIRLGIVGGVWLVGFIAIVWKRSPNPAPHHQKHHD